MIHRFLCRNLGSTTIMCFKLREHGHFAIFLIRIRLCNDRCVPGASQAMGWRTGRLQAFGADPLARTGIRQDPSKAREIPGRRFWCHIAGEWVRRI